MWERFSYYGMRALLVFYMVKGFLGYTDDDAYAVYGTYTSLVYATPFIGGMLADRLLGRRRAVVIGGLLMAAGHLIMSFENETMFFMALALLIVGNGFFKPNISTMVGAMYPQRSGRRDGGFTIFYMGINLGAAMAPLLCGYIGETYGWHYGFGLATIGMLIGLAIFVAPTLVAQSLILVGALSSAAAMFYFPNTIYQLVVSGAVGLALIAAAVVAVIALGRGGLPADMGQPPSLDRLRQKLGGVLRTDLAIYLGIAASIPVIVLLMNQNTIARGLLFSLAGVALLYLIYEMITRCTKVERERLLVVLVLMVFSLLFWAFFEQAGSSINNFTDRNVDRVIEARDITSADIGQTLDLTMNQEQLGYRNGASMINLTALDKARTAKQDTIAWQVTEDHVGMGVGGEEIPASVFQSANAIYILIFGLIFTAIWGFLGSRGMEPSIPVKFALGLLQLGLGFAAMWYGAESADGRG
ncbi:MAG: peptide MFS transporter, partial [Myxococcota bacterium]